MTFVIEVIDEKDPTVMNPPENITVKGGIPFTHKIEPRIFADTEETPMTIYATLPGYHYTDIKLPDWLNYRTTTQTFRGKAPVKNESYDIVMDILGADREGNTVKTVFMITVLPNTPCVPKHTNMTHSCEAGSFCSFTVLSSFFNETENDPLLFSVPKLPESWMSWSSLNKTIFGVPEGSSNTSLTIEAEDPAMLMCSFTLHLSVLDAPSTLSL